MPTIRDHIYLLKATRKVLEEPENLGRPRSLSAYFAVQGFGHCSCCSPYPKKKPVPTPPGLANYPVQGLEV